MLSKAASKFIKSLQIKKYRKQEQCFVVEGVKSVVELLRSDYKVKMVLGSSEFLTWWYSQPEWQNSSIEWIEVSAKELADVGSFQSNDGALAVAQTKENVDLQVSEGEFALVLDDIRDPGNLGTIIRTADWYSIHKIIASEETADFYNSKVITATMGSFTRVSMFYTSLVSFLSDSGLPVLGTFLEGEDVHQAHLRSGGLIVIGNESRGISSEVANCVTRKITIPRYGKAESLNAGVATAVILDNLRRLKN